MVPVIELKGSAFKTATVYATGNMLVHTIREKGKEEKLKITMPRKGTGGKDQIVELEQAIAVASNPDDPSMQMTVKPGGSEKIYENDAKTEEISVRIPSKDHVQVEPLK